MPQPLPKPPNQELISHEKKRQIEAKVFSLGKKLRAEGKTEDEVKARQTEERERLRAEMEKNIDKMDLRDKHQAAAAKLKHMDKLKSALKISDDLKEGECFDMEL